MGIVAFGLPLVFVAGLVWLAVKNGKRRKLLPVEERAKEDSASARQPGGW